MGYVIVRIQNVLCILASPYLISIEKEEAFVPVVEVNTLNWINWREGKMLVAIPYWTQNLNGRLNSHYLFLPLMGYNF